MSYKITFILVLLIFQSAAFAQNSQWRPVSGARKDNLSGMALIEHVGTKTDFIIVNDNKKKDQNHAAVVTVDGRNAPQYTPLKWLGDDVPTDLEAICSVPNQKNVFMAMTAAGRIYHIALDRADNSVKVLKSFDVPKIPADSDFEGFAVQKISGATVAVWADRGLDAKPAQLFFAVFDLQNGTFSNVSSMPFKVPSPTGKTRHISDLKVDETGAVFVSSASDPGNDGPFSSAVYFAGVLNAANPSAIFFTQPSALTRLYLFDYHKVEAIEFVPGATGGIAFGTDDENLGSAIYFGNN